jgi:hypothetical protein
VHWGTFVLALNSWDEPAETLLALAKPQKLRVITPRPGEAIEPKLVDAANPWWRSVGGA